MAEFTRDATDRGLPRGHATGPTAGFVFVGERRSSLAIARGFRWEDGRLAALTLHDALRAVGLDPAAQVYLNLCLDDPPREVDPDALGRIRSLKARGMRIVGMGRKVQRALARGAIRARAVCRAHVARVVGIRHRADAQPCSSGSS